MVIEQTYALLEPLLVDGYVEEHAFPIFALVFF